MSIRDQDIMVLHRTIPNPMVIPDQAIATVHLHTIPNPMVIPGRAITAVPRHTIPSPMVIRGPVDKWWPVISPLSHRWSIPYDHFGGGNWIPVPPRETIPRARCSGTLIGI